jgi:alpha-ketoglutarate-dependent taurine dioxygenase
MNGLNIYPEWITEYKLSYDDIMSVDADVWRQQLASRVLLIFRGLGTTLTDEQYHAFGTKFGRVWDKDDYEKTPGDNTIRNKETAPVSYFQTADNSWGAREMKYHSDMAHMEENSFPGRALYMVRGAEDGSGATSWLNLESAWEQCTDEERKLYEGITVVQQDMYNPGTRLEKFDFLKTNPLSGKVSPRVNCYITPLKNKKAWIHHIEKHDKQLALTGLFVEEVYKMCEQKQNTLYTHHWEDGDILVYDNFGTVHKREPVTLQPGESDRLLKRLTFNVV